MTLDPIRQAIAELAADSEPTIAVTLNGILAAHPQRTGTIPGQPNRRTLTAARGPVGNALYILVAESALSKCATSGYESVAQQYGGAFKVLLDRDPDHLSSGEQALWEVAQLITRGPLHDLQHVDEPSRVAVADALCELLDVKVVVS